MRVLCDRGIAGAATTSDLSPSQSRHRHRWPPPTDCVANVASGRDTEENGRWRSGVGVGLGIQSNPPNCYCVFVLHKSIHNVNVMTMLENQLTGKFI